MPDVYKRQVTMSAASGRRIAEVLNDQADLVNPENPDPVIPDGRIDFDHVNFSYKHGSGKETLTDIDLHIKAGETVGIIGGTGCGKMCIRDRNTENAGSGASL